MLTRSIYHPQLTLSFFLQFGKRKRQDKTKDDSDDSDDNDNDNDENNKNNNATDVIELDISGSDDNVSRPSTVS